MLWIFFTISATILQTFRNIEQKNLGKKLDALSASWSRFIMPLPLAIICLILTAKNINFKFLQCVLICSVFQILGNVMMIKTLQSKNFSIGIAFMKTEALQAVIVGAIIFSQSVSNISLIAIIIASIGVVLISNLKISNSSTLLNSLKSSSTLFGLFGGFCFSITGFNIKIATNNLDALGYGKINAGIITLMWIIFLQNILFIAIKFYQKKLVNDFKKIVHVENKKSFLKASFFSFFGSIAWFCAYSYGEVILVKTLGQIELVFALLVSHFMFKERHNFKEIIGIFLILMGILVVINYN